MLDFQIHLSFDEAILPKTCVLSDQIIETLKNQLPHQTGGLFKLVTVL